MRRVVSAAFAGLLLLGASGRATAVGNLNNHGGPTMQTARVHLIFWLPAGTQFDSTVMDGIGNYQTLLERFVNDVSATGYLDIVTQYPGACDPNQCVLSNGPGVVSLGGSFLDTRAYPHAGTQMDPLQDSDIQGEITHAIAVNGWTAGVDAEFFVLTGAGVEECNGSGSCTFNSFCAYHGSFDSSGTKVIYGYLSDASFNTGGCGEGISTSVNGQLSSDREVALMSHEFIESITDPLSGASAWWNSSDGSEIGDNCNQQPGFPSLGGNPYVVQLEWSNDTSSCVSTFGPSVRLDIATGGDDLRGDSTATASLERTDMSSIESVSIKNQSDPSFGNNTGHIVVAGYSGGANQLANLALTLTSHNGFIETDDNWNVDGVALRLLQPTGALICEQDLSGSPLTRLTGSAPTATFATPHCGPPPPPTFDQITFGIVTGGDDLRGDSDATATITVMGQPPQTVTLKAQGDPSWDNNSTHTRMFTLSSAQPLAAFVNVTVTLTSHNGFIETDDNWNIQTINVTLTSSGGGGSACLLSGAGNPFVRLTGSSPSITVAAGSGC